MFCGIGDLRDPPVKGMAAAVWQGLLILEAFTHVRDARFTEAHRPRCLVTDSFATPRRPCSLMTTMCLFLPLCSARVLEVIWQQAPARFWSQTWNVPRP